MPLTLNISKNQLFRGPWPLFNYKAVDDHSAHFYHGHMIVITVFWSTWR